MRKPDWLLLVALASAVPAAFAGCAANDIACQQRAAAEQRKQQEQENRQESHAAKPQVEVPFVEHPVTQQNERQLQQQQQQAERQYQQQQQQLAERQYQQQQELRQRQQDEQLRLQRFATPQPNGMAQPVDQAAGQERNISQRYQTQSSSNAAAPSQSPGHVAAPITQPPSARGALRISTGDGRQLTYRSDGTLASVQGQGSSATLYQNGQISSLQTGTLNLTRTPTGVRVVRQQLPNQLSVVSSGARRGYVQQQVNWQGKSVTQRTFINNGRSSSRTYGRYTVNGIVLYAYIPVVYYNPYYYGWAYFPWATPVYPGWAWRSAPWYRANVGYFMIAPYYQSPSLWMTDQMLGNMVQSSYDDPALPDQSITDMAPGYVPDDPLPAPVYAPSDTPITPELKQSIADQVGQQVLVENAAAQAPQNADALYSLAKALQPNHLFVVAQPLSVLNTKGQACALRAGDVLQLLAAPDPMASSADLTVDASRIGDCPTDSVLEVQLTDLQEMQNEFRYQVDRGLQSLNSMQGQGGVPTAPAAAYAPAPVVTGLPPPTPLAQALVSGAQQQADQAEAQLVQIGQGH